MTEKCHHLIPGDTYTRPQKCNPLRIAPACCIVEFPLYRATLAGEFASKGGVYFDPVIPRSASTCVYSLGYGRGQPRLLESSGCGAELSTVDNELHYPWQSRTSRKHVSIWSNRS
jgi:hypothetical protein